MAVNLGCEFSITVKQDGGVRTPELDEDTGASVASVARVARVARVTSVANVARVA